MVICVVLVKYSGTVCVLHNGSEMSELIFQPAGNSLPCPVNVHCFLFLATELATSI